MSLDTSYIAAAGRMTGTTAAFSGTGIAAANTRTGAGDCLLTLSDIALAAKIKCVQLTSKTATVIPRLGTIDTTAGTIQVLGKQGADGVTSTDCDTDILVICGR